MAIPSGSGSEVLKTGNVTAFNHTADNKILDGVANHIYTILSIIIVNSTATATGLNLYIFPSANSGNRVDLLKGSTGGTIIPAYGTFVFSDKFVITGTDELVITAQSGGGGDLDAWLSYIDQDWS